MNYEPWLKRLKETYRTIRFYSYKVWMEDQQKRVQMYRLESAHFWGEADDIYGCQKAAEEMVEREREYEAEHFKFGF